MDILKQQPVQRVLKITVQEGGPVTLSGDEFTVGELSQIGNQLINVAQSQRISFKTDEPGKNTEQSPE